MNIYQFYSKSKYVNVLIRSIGMPSILLATILFFSSAYINREAVAYHTDQKQMPNILVLIADDWGYPNAGIYGDKAVKTPNFDKLAKSGALFTNAFTTPSCSPSRASLLTGQWPHNLEEGVHLRGFLPKKFPNYTELLSIQGYTVGLYKKGWGPGQYQLGGYEHNPAGQSYPGFKEFYKGKPKDKPFCFWYGSTNPHRPYKQGMGAHTGKTLASVTVPAFLPDRPEIRSDILDYYYEVEEFDKEVGEVIKILEAAGELENTLIVIAGDNGMPFPRAKANLYDAGTHVPLAIIWPGKIKAGQELSDFVGFNDLAPTFLEAAGQSVPSVMSGKSLLSLVTGKVKTLGRDKMFVERERHAEVREGNIGYPARGIRTKDFLYIRNFRPERWPAGDPEMGSGMYGDIDGSPTKTYIIAHKNEPEIAPFFQLAFLKRPAEELYDLKNDPNQLKNVALDKRYLKTREKLSTELANWMKETRDPRLNNGGDYLEKYPYTTAIPAKSPTNKK
ncbi:sulfatase [Chitinophaga sp. XS-30]|uniref:sulfatase family protein n=1 Tax=Chitinophaga sp. XS-30 TaxID=2604421 RepID=UPI0011DC7DAA|nr:sulfatase [Chitinophaga sp. XS-30]QEH41781.1 sulfatase [Chitinophaga sp. XS-30]